MQAREGVKLAPMPTQMYSQSEIDDMFNQLEDRVTALEEGTTPEPPEPPTGEMTTSVWAFWPNAASLADWASIGVDHFIIPKPLTDSNTPSVDQCKPYTVIAPYHASYSTSANKWLVAHFIEPDEPDAAAGSRPLPIDPAKYAADAKKVKDADPSRPTFSSLGRSYVDLYYNGRGSAQSGKEEPLKQYCAAVDTMMFFCYPMTVTNSNTNAAIYRKINCPQDGVERMARLAPNKPIGFCMEAGNIYDVRRPTYDEMMTLGNNAVDKARALGVKEFKLTFFNQKTVNGYDGNDGLKNPDCRRAMKDLATRYA